MFLKKLINKSINKGYEANECQICHAEFNMLKFDRIHKCKRCFKFICTPCGDFKGNFIDEEAKQIRRRVCLNCKNDIELINNTIAKYHMRWEKDSLLAKQWVACIKAKYNRNYEFTHFFNFFHKSGNKFNDQAQIIAKDVIRGRTDFSVFNYSMKQFFYTVQNVENIQTTRLNIANVLYAIAARYDKVGYCQGMSGIAAFLLCFAQEESAYIIFCDLIEHIFPPQFFERNSFGVALIGLLAQIYFLKEYYWIFVQSKKQLLSKQMQEWFTTQQIEHTKMITQLAGTKALLSIFIGVLNFTNLIFIWQQLKQKRSFEVVERAFLAIIYLNRKNILQQRSFKKLQTCFQLLDLQSFRQTYADIEIDQKIKRKLINQFYLQNNTKWSSSKNGNAYTLSKVTNLSEKEIKLLQKSLCNEYSNEELVTKIVLNQEEFVDIIGIYNQILKKNSLEGEQIMQMAPLILKKMYKIYASKPQEGLTFRQFIGCFSICTKSNIKERISAIMSTLLDSQGKISYQNFSKMMNSFIMMAPKRLQNLKYNFAERVNTFFVQIGSITLAELHILLNDLFINGLNDYIRCDCEGITQMVVNEYHKIEKMRSNESKAKLQGQIKPSSGQK